MKNKYLTSGSVIAAILASICCIGPVVLVGIGVGSLAFFSQFNALRPYFIIGSLLLLVPAFYFAYRKREVKCEDGSCKIESAGKWNQISVWIAAIFVAGFIAFPYFSFALPDQNKLAADPEFQTVVLKINNMDCEACARGLEKQLRNLNGVKSAEINFAKGEGKVLFNPVKTDKKKLSLFLTEEGYPAEVKKINKDHYEQ